MPRTSWSKRIDLAAALDGAPPPSPSVCAWADQGDDRPVSRALFYPNEVHSVFGEPESMKSWLVLHAAAQEVQARRHVMYVDMEANDRSIVHRLLALGVPKDKVERFFRYFRPDEKMTRPDQVALRKQVAKHHPTLIVLDGVTEAFAVQGYAINSPEDTARWFRDFARQFQITPNGDDYQGPAIVELDHVVKSRDDRNGWAIGSQHKKAGLKGAAYEVVVKSPFGKGKHGKSRLFLSKDSPGGVEWVPYGKDRRRLVAELHCDSDGHGIEAWLESADASDAPDESSAAREPLTATVKFRTLMQEVSKYVADNPGCSAKRVKGGVAGTDAHKDLALEELVAGGFIRDEGKAHHRYVHVKDFSILSAAKSSSEEA